MATMAKLRCNDHGRHRHPPVAHPATAGTLSSARRGIGRTWSHVGGPRAEVEVVAYGLFDGRRGATASTTRTTLLMFQSKLRLTSLKCSCSGLCPVFLLLSSFPPAAFFQAQWEQAQRSARSAAPSRTLFLFSGALHYAKVQAAPEAQRLELSSMALHTPVERGLPVEEELP